MVLHHGLCKSSTGHSIISFSTIENITLSKGQKLPKKSPPQRPHDNDKALIVVVVVVVLVVLVVLVLNREEAVVGVQAHDSSHAPTKAERKVVRCLSLSHR